MTAASTDSTTRREVVVDAALADIWERRATASHYLGYALDGVHRVLGERQGHGRTMPRWQTTHEEAVEKVRAFVADEANPSWRRSEAASALASVEKHRAEIEACEAEAEPYEDEYDRAPWSRFFLVKANGGHIHSSMRCSTCYPSTRFGWLPTLSGLTEADAVAEQGPMLCSVCFPSAPVEWTVGKQASAGCAGSGKFAEGKALELARAGRRYVPCPACGEVVALTSNWKIRKHKPKEADAR